ncbi:hypothetical protein E2C01_069010 [Portunus trituberculatus]|uniref:Uncharacterized protein n=1 Tax=Portunus trituberculatus TaxID=210409 RepID=A0A5B7HTI4_PORTR|nr:hypothetical protein [Portunus trituberculatus]
MSDIPRPSGPGAVDGFVVFTALTSSSSVIGPVTLRVGRIAVGDRDSGKKFLEFLPKRPAQKVLRPGGLMEGPSCIPTMISRTARPLSWRHILWILLKSLLLLALTLLDLTRAPSPGSL